MKALSELKFAFEMLKESYSQYFIEKEFPIKYKNCILYAKPDLILVFEYTRDDEKFKCEIPIEIKFSNPPKSFNENKVIQDVLQTSTYAEVMSKKYAYLMYIGDQDVKIYLVDSTLGRQVIQAFKNWVDSSYKKLTIKTIYCNECYFYRYCEYAKDYEDKLLYPEIKNDYIIDFDNVKQSFERIELYRQFNELAKYVCALAIQLFEIGK